MTSELRLNKIMSKKSHWYQKHLDLVSRSFALGISELEEPLREWVGFSYLLCRLVDTIEDSDWPSPDQQQRQFDQFLDFLRESPSVEATERWQKQIPWQTLHLGEQLLLKDSHQLFLDFHNLPRPVQEIIYGPVQTMTRGMAQFISLKGPQGLQLVNSLELDHYCFFVAGIVGEILTLLMNFLVNQQNQSENNFESFPLSEQLKHSFHFGLFLQKINILKDEKEDQKRGVAFFTDRASLVKSLRTHAVYTKRYLLALPPTMSSYRVFCAFSFALGLASLPYILQLPGFAEKMDREQTIKLMQEVRNQSANPMEFEKLLQMGIDLIPQDEELANFPTEIKLQSRLTPESFYQGRLAKEEIAAFFLA